MEAKGDVGFATGKELAGRMMLKLETTSLAGIGFQFCVLALGEAVVKNPGVFRFEFIF